MYLCISHGCFPWTTPFCARKRCNLEGMTAKISVFFPEQNVDLTDLYTRLLTEESCIMHQIKENLFVFLFLELVFPISIYRKTYIRNSKCWLKNRYGARSFRYNWRGIEPLKITNDILRKSKSMESFSFI